MKNWIRWIPLEGQSFWSASNIAKVWSRGLEARFRLNFQPSTIRYQLKGSYHFTRSTNQIALEFPNIPKGQQLFYTPQHQVFGQLGVHWRNWKGVYQHRFVGSSIGVNENLNAYHLGQLRLGYHWRGKKIGGNIFVKIDNLWDTSYFVIDRRPVAGRFFQLGAALAIEDSKRTLVTNECEM